MMTDKDVIAFLKDRKAAPPTGAVERCIASLPDVKRRNGILPLIRSQLFNLPPGMYAAALAMIAVQLKLVAGLEPGNALVMTGISSSLVTLLLAWHLALSATAGMEEIERCCRYSYGQILLSRVLCLCILTTAALMVPAVSGAVRHQIGLGYVVTAMLPTALGALSAILWANYRNESDRALMSVYLVAASIASLCLERIAALGAAVAGLLLLGAAAAIVLQTRSLMNRRIRYEALHC